MQHFEGRGNNQQSFALFVPCIVKGQSHLNQLDALCLLMDLHVPKHVEELL
jgi:hypothetical protein